MVAKRRRRCPQEHGGMAQRAPAGRGGPEVRMPAVPSSACQCPRPASGVWCERPASRVPVHAAAVQCSVRTSERPDVRRRPVSSVGVRCPWVPASIVSGREVVEGGGGGRSPTAGMAGVGVVARRVHGQFVVSPARILAIEAGAGRAGSAEASAWAWPSWEVVGQWPGRPRGRPGQGRICAGIARWWRAGVCSEAATTLRGHHLRPRAESPGRCESPGLGWDLRVRPWCGRSMQ
jgi:hypothetical protein